MSATTKTVVLSNVDKRSISRDVMTLPASAADVTVLRVVAKGWLANVSRMQKHAGNEYALKIHHGRHGRK